MMMMTRSLRGVFLDPYFQLVCGAIMVTAAEIFLKIGASTMPDPTGRWSWTGLNALASIWVWWGILLMVLSFLTWLYVLKLLPLAVAYPISNMVHIFVPLGCWLFLGEAINARRWCGISLVLIGLLVVAKPFSKIEERL